MIIFSPFVGAEANVANRALSFSFIVLITIICVHNYQLHCFPLYFHYLELKTLPLTFRSFLYHFSRFTEFRRQIELQYKRNTFRFSR